MKHYMKSGVQGVAAIGNAAQQIAATLLVAVLLLQPALVSAFFAEDKVADFPGYNNTGSMNTDKPLLAVDEGQAYKRIISGTIFENGKKIPVKFVTVELLRKSDQAVLSKTNTDAEGKYSMATDENEALLVKVNVIGYQSVTVPVEAGAANVTVPAVYLELDYQKMTAVNVVSKRPLVKQEIDGLSYDVQADPESKFTSLLDMIRKVPFISVDADDNVKLKSSSSYRVLIDGKESSIIAGNPRDVFKSMPATNVLRIEVITNPPSKYDGEGLAGIINIITVKKMAANGYNGSIGVNYKDPSGPWSNANINFKAGRLGISAYAGFSFANIPLTNFTIVQRSLIGLPATVSQRGRASTNSDREYMSTQISYEIDSLTVATASLGYNMNSSDRSRYIHTNQISSTISQSYSLNNQTETKGDGYDLGLDFQRLSKKNKARFLTGSYRYSANKSNVFNSVESFEKINYEQADFNQRNKSGVREHTGQLDYTIPVKKIIIETGVKAILRDNFSYFLVRSYDSAAGGFKDDPFSSNDFTYQQNVYSVYNSYLANLNKWTFRLGARLERTTVDARFITASTNFSTEYNNFLPSLAVQHKLSKATSINLGYSERIRRPGIAQLNPFVDRQNPVSLVVGNPFLKPELSQAFSLNLSVSKKVNFNFGASYSYSNNTIQTFAKSDASGITTFTFGNLGKNKSLGFDMNINYPVTKQLNVSLNSQLNFLRFSGFISNDSIPFGRNGTVGNVNLFAGYKFGKEWRTSLTLLYFSPNINLQGTSSPFYYASWSLSKNLLKKRLTISGSISNPFSRFLRYETDTYDQRFIQNIDNEIVYRRFNLGVNFKFGKLKDGSIKKSRENIKNDDVKVVPSLMPN
jgi:outer membrane receptor protein involved in Fe transport